MTLIYRSAPVTSFTAQRGPVLLYQSLCHMEFSNRRGQWFAFGDPRICIFACCARRRLWKHNWLHLLTLTGFLCRTRKSMRGVANEVAQELILGTPVSVSNGVPRSSSRRSGPACWWLSLHRAVFGSSVTAEVFVADLRLAQPDLFRPPDTISPKYLLFLSVLNGVRPDGLTK